MSNFHPGIALLPFLALLSLLNGCAAASGTTPVRIPVSAFKAEFPPIPPPDSGVRTEASATLEVSAEMTPDVRQFWRTGYCGDEAGDSYLGAIKEVLTEGIAQSGLFSRIVPAGGPRPDIIVKVRYEESDISNIKAELTLSAFDAASGREISSHSGKAALGVIGEKASPRAFTLGSADGRPVGAYSGLSVISHKVGPVLQAMLPHLEQSLADAVLAQLLQPKQELAVAALRTTTLPDLLVTTDSTLELARARNRALVAAKIEQLPKLLRNSSSQELTALQVRIEQLMLDLDHESVMTNDRAQRILANNGNPQHVDGLRGLAICYRERIELLKPIAAAIKEELANRNR